MEKVTSINLGGYSFIIEEEAYQKLKAYLDNVKKHIGHGADKEEVMSDIEMGIAEKLKERITQYKEVITRKDIEELISIMGNPEQIDQADPTEEEEVREKTIKKLYRNPDDLIIAGVCGGLGAYFSIDPVIVRIIFVALFFSGGIGLPIYIILWIITPMAETKSQKFQMKGDELNISNIEKSHKSDKEKEQRSPFVNSIDGVMVSCGKFFKTVFSLVIPLMKICFSLGLICVSLAAIMGIVILTGIAFSYINSGYYFNDIPMDQIISSLPYVPMIVFGFLASILPFIFLTIAGISIISKKNFITLTMIVIFMASWMMSVAALAVLGIRYVPDVIDRVRGEESLKEAEKFIDTGEFNSVDVGGNHLRVVLKKGDTNSVKAYGRPIDLGYLSSENKDGVLKIINSRREVNPKCIGCFQGTVTLEITATDLQKIKMENGYLEISDEKIGVADITGSNLTISVEVPMERLSVKNSGGTLSLKNDISYLDARLDNSILNNKGKIKEGEIYLNGSLMDSFKGSIEKGFLSIKNDSWVATMNGGEVTAEIDSTSGIYHINKEGKDIILKENQDGARGMNIRLKEVSSLEFNDNEDADNYFRFNDTYYMIEDEVDSDTYQEYRMKLRNTF
jgi:phage shock protein PspC (stress-responsive transcriptional regulator)